jgi:putative copper export protein/cytochrome c oxidase assembly factor CtaG
VSSLRLETRLGRTGGATSGGRMLLAVVTAVVLTTATGLAVSGGATATGRSAGLSDAGGVTARLLPLTRSLFDLAAVGTIGAVLALAWLVPHGAPAVVGRRLRTAAAAWAAAWFVAAALNLLASVSQVVGVPVVRLLGSLDLLSYGIGLPQGRAMLLVMVGALALALWIGTVRTTTGCRAWSFVAPALMAPLLATGHAATASDHFLATEMLLVHVIAVTLWMGGLLALVVHLRAFPSVLPDAVRRFSVLALPCFAVVGLSGLVSAWTRLGLDPGVWTSTYGVLLLLKIGAFATLGYLGWLHRSRSLASLRAGGPRVFARIAAVEVVVLGVAVGLAVVLARTAPPIAASLRAVPPHAAAFPTVDATLRPLSPLTALLETRPDALVLSFLVAAAVVLLVWVRGTSTVLTPGRWLRLLAGLVVTGWSLVGGLGAYSTSLLSAEVTQVLVLATLAPPLLAWGLPPDRVVVVTTWIGRGPLRGLLNPTNAAVLLVVLVAVTFQTPLLDASLRSELGHLGVGLAALGAGLLLFLPMAAPSGEPTASGGPAGTGQGRQPVAGLLALAGVLLFYGWRMRLSSQPYAGGWFRDLDLWWADAAADQRLAGWTLIGFALLLAALAVVLTQRRSRRPTPRRRVLQALRR